MNLKLQEELDLLHAQICGAVSDPKRIMILYLLKDGSKTVSQLMNEMELTQPAISRNMKILKERNMVTVQREGKNLVYSLRDHRVIEALDLFRAMLLDMIESQAALARALSADIKIQN